MKNLYKIEDELYIVSNTENISENCWIITNDKLVQVSYLLSDEVAKGFKVILTTNDLLIKDGVQAIDDEFLEWFVKNPNCEEIEVVDVRSLGVYGSYYPYKINIPKKETKQETLEEAAEKYDENDPNDEYGKSYRAFIEGAKWQQEQEKITTDDAYNEGFENGKHWQQEKSYSEEDLREAFKSGGKMSWTDINQETQEPYYYDFNEWFEQFKKK